MRSFLGSHKIEISDSLKQVESQALEGARVEKNSKKI